MMVIIFMLFYTYVSKKVILLGFFASLGVVMILEYGLLKGS